MTLTYEYAWPAAWLLATVVTRREGEGDPLVIGVHLTPLEAPIEQTNAFTLEDKPVGHYVMLAVAGLVPLTILATLLAVLAARGLRRRWVWALGVLFGMGSVSLDWASGEWEVSPISVYMLGSGVSRAGPYAPWVLSTSVPVGALMFLFGRRRRPVPAALPDRSA